MLSIDIHYRKCWKNYKCLHSSMLAAHISIVIIMTLHLFYDCTNDCRTQIDIIQKYQTKNIHWMN